MNSSSVFDFSDQRALGVPGILLRTRCLANFLRGLHTANRYDASTGDLVCRRQAEFAPEQPLVQKPDTPGVSVGLLGPALDLIGMSGEKQALQYGEVEAFIFEGKG
jgi:hypothetical protein